MPPRSGPKVFGRFSHLFSDTGFRGPVLTLLSGSAVAAVISFGAQIILARLYTPTDFGVANYFISVLSILITFSSLRYEDAVMLPADDREAAALGWGALLLVGGFSLALLGLTPVREQAAAWVEVPGLAPFVPLIPAALFSMRLFKVLENWHTRKSAFRKVSRVQVSSNLMMSAYRLAVGFARPAPGAGGLIGGFVAAQVLGAAIYGRHAVRAWGRTFREAFAWAPIRAGYLRYYTFSVFSTPSALIGIVLIRLPLLLLPLIGFSEDVLGRYAVATNLMAIPFSLIGTSVGQVFFVQAAEARRSGGLGRLLENVHQRLVMLGIFPTLAVMLAGPQLCGLIYGPEWREAGVYLQLLAAWLFLAAVVSPLTYVYDVLEKQRAALIVNLTSLALLAAALAAPAGAERGILEVLLRLSIAGVGTRLLQLGVAARLAGANAGALGKAHLRYGLLSAPFLLPAAGALALGSAWGTLAALALGGLGYAALLIRREGLLRARPEGATGSSGT